MSFRVRDGIVHGLELIQEVSIVFDDPRICSFRVFFVAFELVDCRKQAPALLLGFQHVCFMTSK